MKRAHRRLPVPQHEFRFAVETFRLFAESGVDGERITLERAEADKARRLAESSQTSLPQLSTLNSQYSHD
jgi:hypothetical protein